MILTAKEVQYLDISNTKLREDLTISATAQTFGISETRVNNAIAWAKKNRVNNMAAAEDLDITIASLQKRLDWLEVQRKRIQRESRRMDKDTHRYRVRSVPYAFSAMYLREARKTELAIAELKGIYKRTIDVNHTGAIDAKVTFYIPDNGRDKMNEAESEA